MLVKIVEELMGGKKIMSDTKLEHILHKHVNSCNKDSMCCSICQHLDTKLFDRNLCAEKLCELWVLVRDHLVSQGP